MGISERQFLPTSDGCFICGEGNAAGLQTQFYIEDGRVKTRVQPRTHHCGYPGVIHGGIVAALLDECMGWAAAQAIARMCLTAELTVRYLINAPNDRELIISTEVVKSNRRLVLTQGELVDDAGTQFATASGKFLPMSADETLRVDDALNYRGGEARLFDGLRGGESV